MMKIIESIKNKLSYRAMIIIDLQCNIPYKGEYFTYHEKCKLYENKEGKRKCNMSVYKYPLYYSKYKEYVEKFLNHNLLNIPSYRSKQILEFKDTITI